jgi:hypothetical protein
MHKQLGMPAMNKTELKKPLNKQQFRIMALREVAVVVRVVKSEILLLWEK